MDKEDILKAALQLIANEVVKKALENVDPFYEITLVHTEVATSSRYLWATIFVQTTNPPFNYAILNKMREDMVEYFKSDFDISIQHSEGNTKGSTCKFEFALFAIDVEDRLKSER